MIRWPSEFGGPQVSMLVYT